MNPAETVREAVRELSEVLLDLGDPPTERQADRAARIVERQAEDLAEVAEQLRKAGAMTGACPG